MTSVPIAASDLTWLNMDEPTNLMVVNGLMWFDEEPDWGAVREVLRSRLVEGYPVMARAACRSTGAGCGRTIRTSTSIVRCAM